MDQAQRDLHVLWRSRKRVPIRFGYASIGTFHRHMFNFVWLAGP
jgi:hypothetical protein